MAGKLKQNKYVAEFKQGLADIKTVAQEGNFKLFAKQVVVVAVVALILY